MKKSKLTVGIMTAILAAGTLAGCDNTVKYNAEGKIITYQVGDNDPVDVKADDLLEDYYKDSSKFQSIFDAINSIVVRNYFSKDPFIEEVDIKTKDSTGKIVTTKKQLGKPQMPQIELDAEKKVDSDKKTAQTNADNNGTSYNDEFKAILDSHGAEDEADLKKKYVDELKKTTFEDNFYKYFVEDIKNGDEDYVYESSEGDKQLWNGYFNDMVPYHVSHILVKVEDGSGTNYANGTISEDNAKKLFNVVDALAKGDDSFRTIAHRFSEDTGSAANYGDLGIMDYSTGYVNEFKLGVYAYENFLTKGEVKEAVQASNIKIPGNGDDLDPDNVTGIAKSFLDESEKAFGQAVPEIDYDVFVQLNKEAKTDKDKNGKSVIDDSANFYPRNIIYNKHLNRHSVALITTASPAVVADVDAKVNTTGFVKNGTGEDCGLDIAGLAAGKYVLAVKTASGWTPVLCTRAGSDYQGIHFIIVNRSNFVMEDENEVSRSEYYTTYYPEQDDYPVYPEGHANAGNPKPTYINYASSAVSDTQTKANSLLSTLKSYDSERLNKYIFEKYFEMEGIELKDEKLAEILSMWVSRGFDKKEQEKNDAWEKTWNDYIDTLRKQNSDRSQLVSDACRLAYVYGNGLDENRQQVTVGDMLGELAQAMVDAKEIDPETGNVFTLEAAKKYIKSIRIGSGVIKPQGTDKDLIKETDPISVLFKKEGALCNDGKEHI